MDDLIKRSDAIEAITFSMLNALNTEERISLIMSLPSAEPSVGYVGVGDDYLVSVKEVLNITAETGALETQRRVKELPRRDRPQGEWIFVEEFMGFNRYKCSVCEREEFLTYLKNFCSNCGARMKGADDETD